MKSVLLFRRPTGKHAAASAAADPESLGSSPSAGDSQPVQQDGEVKIEQTDTLFVWKGLNYTVNVKGGTRKLLDNIQGFTKPGVSVGLWTGNVK